MTYMRHLVDDARNLTAQEFRVLAIMAADAYLDDDGNLVYDLGIRRLAARAGYALRQDGSCPTLTAILAPLRRSGRLVQVSRGNRNSFAAYVLTIPKETRP